MTQEKYEISNLGEVLARIFFGALLLLIPYEIVKYFGNLCTLFNSVETCLVPPPGTIFFILSLTILVFVIASVLAINKALASLEFRKKNTSKDNSETSRSKDHKPSLSKDNSSKVSE